MASELQVSVEALEGLERKLTVEVPATRIDAAISDRLQSLRKTVRLDGFRPGKVPLKVVQQRFGPQVRQEVLGEVIQSSFRDAVVEEQLSPAGMPHIEPLPQAEAAGFRYSATFEVYPEVDVASPAGLKIEKPSASLGEPDVDEMLESLRKQRTEWDAVERPAADGDQVVMDFAGFVDGEPLENAKAEQYRYVVGSGALIPGFDEQLLGVSAGDARKLEVTFPEHYRPEELAGKPATFEVTVHAVEAARLPTLDDDFAQAFGVPEGGLAALREKVRANMDRELRQTLRQQIKSRVMDALLGANEVLLPAALVHEEIQRLKKQYAQGSDMQLADEPFAEQARRRVRLGLLMAEIIKRNELQADPERVRAAVEEQASTYEDPQQVINYYYGNKDMLGSVEAMVLEDQVVDWVLEQAQVSEVKQTFKEIVHPEAPTGDNA